MNKTRFTHPSVARIMILTAIITAVTIAITGCQAFAPSVGAAASSLSYSGMGDVHLAEAQQSFPDTGAQVTQAVVGIGDLRRYEAQQSIPATGASISQANVGMGELHRYEAQQALPETGAVSSSLGYTGMGDVHLFESQ